MSNKRALCVGINEFANLPRADWLYGCVNDANDMAALLKSKYGFGPRDVTILTDEKATKAAIVGKLTSMITLAQQGKVKHIVFAYSSHGTQIPDTSGDELDKADEALVAHDLAQDGDQWDPDTVLVDDELGALFAQVPSDVLVEVFLDTCHSGTGLKAMDLLSGRRPKFMPPPTPAGLDDVTDRNVTPFGAASIIRRKRGLKAAATATPVLFAACKADQTSTDDSFNGRSNGAFTYYLLKELRKRSKVSRSELLTAVRSGLRSGRYDQTPQLEAPATAKKEVLGR